MSILSILAFAALAIGIFALAGGFAFHSPGAKAAGLLAVVVGGALMLFASLTSVPAQSVGVVTTFGRPTGTLGSGIHWKVPWHVVHDMDGRTQIDDNLGDRRTEIRLGNQANAYVQNSLRWKIRTDAADRLFADYRDFDRIGPGLVEQELAAALNYAFSDYDPLAAAKAEAGGTANQKSYDDVSEAVKARLLSRIGDRIVIESVIIPKVDFDAATQGRIDAYQAEIGNTRIAEQRKKTAAADAEANRTLAGSVSRDPNVLVSKCLDQLAEMVDKGQAVPAGFTCWPSSGATVIADGRR